MVDQQPEVDSGAAGTMVQLNRALRELGHDVEEVWADDLGHRISNWNLHYLLELPFEFRRIMRHRLDRDRYDIVQVSQPHGYLAARSLHGENSEGRPIFVHVSHGLERRRASVFSKWKGVYPPDEDERGYLRRIASAAVVRALDWNNQAIVRYADGHLVGCTQCALYLQQTMKVPPQKIEIAGRGVPEWMGADPRAMTTDRMNRVLYVGQFVYIKAPMIVAEVMSRLAEVRQELTFTWISAKKDHDRIRRLLHPSARSRVELRDWMTRRELLRAYDSHGLFLFPSFFEGFGKAFLEAMARGLCVVAADSGGARDLIMDGINGRLVRTGDIDQMVDASLDLVDHPALIREISIAASSTARRHTWGNVAERVAGFYARLGTPRLARDSRPPE